MKYFDHFKIQSVLVAPRTLRFKCVVRFLQTKSSEMNISDSFITDFSTVFLNLFSLSIICMKGLKTKPFPSLLSETNPNQYKELRIFPENVYKKTNQS